MSLRPLPEARFLPLLPLLAGALLGPSVFALIPSWVPIIGPAAEAFRNFVKFLIALAALAFLFLVLWAVGKLGRPGAFVSGAASLAVALGIAGQRALPLAAGPGAGAREGTLLTALLLASAILIVVVLISRERA